MRQLTLGMRLADRATFASFCVGAGTAANAEALAAARSLAAGTSCGVLWLTGPPGAGKTHLLQAICAGAGERVAAAFLPLNELLALGPEILDGMQALGCVCIDDIERIAGRRDWELQVFSVLTRLLEEGGALAVAARAPPGLLTWSLPDLGSRFAAAGIHPLRPLDEAGQIEALRLRARLRGLELPDATVRWLQRHYARDMGRLYGLLDTLDEAALVAQRRLTVPFIREVLART